MGRPGDAGTRRRLLGRGGGRWRGSPQGPYGRSGRGRTGPDHGPGFPQGPGEFAVGRSGAQGPGHPRPQGPDGRLLLGWPDGQRAGGDHPEFPGRAQVPVRRPARRPRRPGPPRHRAVPAGGHARRTPPRPARVGSGTGARRPWRTRTHHRRLPAPPARRPALRPGADHLQPLRGPRAARLRGRPAVCAGGRRGDAARGARRRAAAGHRTHRRARDGRGDDVGDHGRARRDPVPGGARRDGRARGGRTPARPACTRLPPGDGGPPHDRRPARDRRRAPPGLRPGRPGRPHGDRQRSRPEPRTRGARPRLLNRPRPSPHRTSRPPYAPISPASTAPRPPAGRPSPSTTPPQPCPSCAHRTIYGAPYACWPASTSAATTATRARCREPCTRDTGRRRRS